MHRKVANKKKWITSGIAGILAVSIIGGTLYSNSTVSMARPSLPGIEDMVMNNSKAAPFTILEIVPDKKDARVGYFVAGEEPGNIKTGEAMSDMAYWEELDNEYMASGSTTKDKPIFDELKDFAFTYDDVSFKQEDPNDPTKFVPYTDQDADVRAYDAYGRMVDATSSNGKYNLKSDMSEVYAELYRDDASTSGHATLEDIMNKESVISDGTGVLYMDFVRFVGKDDPEGVVCKINTFIKQTDDNRKLYPHISYVDGDGNPYYNSMLYVIDKEYVTKSDDNDTDTDISDDYYVMDESSVALEVGDVIYEKSSEDAPSLEYFGYVYMDDTTDPSNPVKMIIGPGTGGNPLKIDATAKDDLDAFSYKVQQTLTLGYSGYVTIREEANDAAKAKYYIEDVTADADGQYKYIITEKAAVNDPSISGSYDSIIIEDASVNSDWENSWGYSNATIDLGTWYHRYFYKKNNQDPYEYVQDHTGSLNFAHDFREDLFKTTYYKGGFVNKELFKKYVLDVDDDKLNDICVDVVTKVGSEVTVDDINSAGLIYFSDEYGKDSGSIQETADLNEQVATALVKQICEQNKPVVVDAASIGLVNENYSLVLKNLRKLFAILALDDLSGISSLVNDDGTWNISDEYNNKTLTPLAHGYYTHTQNGFAYTLNHVEGSVFVNGYGDGTAFGKYFTTEITQIGNSTFTPSGSRTFNYDGCVPVQEDIDQELFYLEVAGKNDGSFNSEISQATIIRYILNYGNRRVVAKNAIRVLDIEPFYNRELEEKKDYAKIAYTKNGTKIGQDKITRDIFTEDWFRKYVVSDNTDKISIYGEGIREFVGKIDDLNENYDLIYIGMDTAYMNTNEENKKKSTTVVRNDGKHYVYSHTGDHYKVQGMGCVNDGDYYGSGNDITPDKLRELKAYVEAGYAVILSDEFFIKENGNVTRKINTDKIEEISYLYEFVDWCLDKGYVGANVAISSDFENNTTKTTTGKTVVENREKFVKYLNISKLTIQILKDENGNDYLPPLYNSYDKEDATEGNHEYLKMNDQGIYTLDYRLRLVNDAATDTTNTTYDCKLYIDHDADGRYEEFEELDNLIIKNLASGDEEDIDTDGKYHLRTGVDYSISRMVPEGYVGLISWKLVFYENGRRLNGKEGDVQVSSDFGDDSKVNLIRVALQDYSAICDLANKPTIKILQLTSSDDGRGEKGVSWQKYVTLDLSGTIDYSTVDLGDAGGVQRNAIIAAQKRLQELYKEVTDFNIEVDICPVNELIVNDTSTEHGIFIGGDRLEKLCEYDMLVLGFTDSYSIGAKNHSNGNEAMVKESMLAIRQYVLSGRSVLFTHDLTSQKLDSYSMVGWYANQYLRDIQGMDRYGLLKDNLANQQYKGEALLPYDSVYDTKLIDSSEKLVYNAKKNRGYTDSAILEYGAGNNIGLINATNQVPSGSDSRQVSHVNRINRGQITEYPFRIGDVAESADDKNKYVAGETVKIADTHHQYLQLNLETNYLDDNGDDDIVVWYTLGNDGFNRNPFQYQDYNDARNNYYIYNKGNITYTGAGHSYITDESELKLFVNTLVAAYNAGKHAPYASYKMNDRANSAEIRSMYIPYDLAFAKPAEEGGDNNGWLEDKATVYFKTINNNLQDNKKPLNTDYFIEVPEGSSYNLMVNNKYYKRIEPVGLLDCTAVGAKKDTGSDAASASHSLSNGRVYMLEFNMDDLMNGDTILGRHNTVIYTRMSVDTSYESMLQKVELGVMPASDSFMPLNINFTELFDLQ